MLQVDLFTSLDSKEYDSQLPELNEGGGCSSDSGGFDAQRCARDVSAFIDECRMLTYSETDNERRMQIVRQLSVDAGTDDRVQEELYWQMMTKTKKCTDPHQLKSLWKLFGEASRQLPCPEVCYIQDVNEKNDLL